MHWHWGWLNSCAPRSPNHFENAEYRLGITRNYRGVISTTMPSFTSNVDMENVDGDIAFPEDICEGKDRSVRLSPASSRFITADIRIENANQASMDPPSRVPKVYGWRFYAAFIALAFVTLVAALDTTSLSVAIPTITSAIGGTAIEAFWSGTSFLLTCTVVEPLFASLSHIFGRKPVSLISVSKNT